MAPSQRVPWADLLILKLIESLTKDAKARLACMARNLEIKQLGHLPRLVNTKLTSFVQLSGSQPRESDALRELTGGRAFGRDLSELLLTRWQFLRLDWGKFRALRSLCSSTPPVP